MRNVAKINHVQLVTASYFAIRIHAMHPFGVCSHVKQIKLPFNTIFGNSISFLFFYIFFFFLKRSHEKTDNLGSRNAIRFELSFMYICIYLFVLFYSHWKFCVMIIRYSLNDINKLHAYVKKPFSLDQNDVYCTQRAQLKLQLFPL